MVFTGRAWAAGEVRSGFCNETDSEDPGDCHSGQMGSWAADANGIKSLEDCSTKCASCRRCRVVSFGMDDCSWFHSCQRLRDGPGTSELDRNFRSVKGRPKTAKPPHGTVSGERLGYATLLSHASFLPGTLALLSSLRAGGAQLPAVVLASAAALLPGATRLIQPFARVHLLSAAVERSLTPSARVLEAMRRKPSECAGTSSHARNATDLAGAHDCSSWQRLSTFAKLGLFAPNTTGFDQLLYLDADCVVRGNLDLVLGGFPYSLSGPQHLSSAGDLNYWNSGVMLLRPSEAIYGQLVRMTRDGDYHIADDPSDQDVYTPPPASIGPWLRATPADVCLRGGRQPHRVGAAAPSKVAAAAGKTQSSHLPPQRHA